MHSQSHRYGVFKPLNFHWSQAQVMCCFLPSKSNYHAIGYCFIFALAVLLLFSSKLQNWRHQYSTLFKFNKLNLIPLNYLLNWGSFNVYDCNTMKLFFFYLIFSFIMICVKISIKMQRNCSLQMLHKRI